MVTFEELGLGPDMDANSISSDFKTLTDAAEEMTIDDKGNQPQSGYFWQCSQIL